MNGLLSAVAGQLKRLRPKADVKAELAEIDGMERDVDQMLRGNTSWIVDSALTKLFFADIERAKELLDDGKKSEARKHISDASASRHCIRLNLRNESGVTALN